MGIHVVLGRDFYPDAVLDSNNIIITESLAKIMNKPNPVGAIIRNDSDRYTVVGMVKDFVYGNMFGTTVDPLIFYCNPHNEYESVMYLRLKKQVNTEKAVALIVTVMKKKQSALSLSVPVCGRPVQPAFPQRDAGE
jgi:hypothetical protein